MSRKNKNKNKKQKKPQPQQHQQNQARQPARQALAARVAGAPSGAAKLVLAIGDPAGNPGMRLPTPEPTRTAVVTLRDQIDITTPTGAATTGHRAGDIVVAFYGQPGRIALVYSAVNTGIGAYAIRFADTYNVGTETATWSLNANALSGSLDYNKPWPFVGAIWSSGNDLHGKTIAPGVSKNVGYIFMNSGDTLTLQSTTFGGSNQGTLNFEVYNWVGEDAPAGLIDAQAFAFLNGSIVGGNLITAAKPGYYAVYFTGFAVISGTIPAASGVQIVCNVSSSAVGKWQQFCHKDVDSRAGGDPMLVESVRVNASSCLVTNTTALTSMQGTVIAARVRDGDATRVTRETLANKAEKYTGMAMKGCYTFREFTASSEQFAESRCGATTFFTFDLDAVDYVYYMILSDPNPTTAANSYSLTIDSTLEFATDSQRYPKDVASGSFIDLMQARRVIAHKPEWFYENPLHMRDVYALARSGLQAAVRGARTAAPYLGTAMSAIDPARANLYSMLSRALM